MHRMISSKRWKIIHHLQLKKALFLSPWLTWRELPLRIKAVVVPAGVTLEMHFWNLRCCALESKRYRFLKYLPHVASILQRQKIMYECTEILIGETVVFCMMLEIYTSSMVPYHSRCTLD